MRASKHKILQAFEQTNKQANKQTRTGQGSADMNHVALLFVKEPFILAAFALSWFPFCECLCLVPATVTHCRCLPSFTQCPASVPTLNPKPQPPAGKPTLESTVGAKLQLKLMKAN